MLQPDYSARDKAIRHNIFASYWRDVHATLCSRLPGLGFYVQQHFDRNHTANLWPVAGGVRKIGAVLDGSAELGFASEEDQAAFAKAGTILYGDEANFIGEAVAYSLPSGSMTFVDREEDGTRNGLDRFHRVHVYMNRKQGADAARWLSDTSAELSRHELVQKWKLHLPEPYSNERPAPPSPNVSHFVEDDRKNVAVAEVAFKSARTAREFFSYSGFQKMLASQERYIDALGAYLVTGFYTFVRDGQPTAAGVRGSRPAELIEAAGAANQLVPDVVSLYSKGTMNRKAERDGV